MAFQPPGAPPRHRPGSLRSQGARDASCSSSPRHRGARGAAALAFFLVLALGLGPATAQEAEVASTLDAAATRIISAIRGRKEKAVVIVLDVSGSMTNAHRLRHSVAALARIVREGTRVGDTVAVFSFDTSPTLVLKETRVKKDADKKIIIDRIPTVSNNTVGSNIRWAHHEALKLLAPSRQPYQVCILVSDNRHDPPPAGDPYHPDYLKYYVPGSMETPDTPESRDYARLREQFTGGTRATYGIGVDVLETGAVRELPPPPRTPAWVYAAILLAVAVLAGGGWLAARAFGRAAAARKAAQAPLTVVVRDVSPDAGTRSFGGDTRLDLDAEDSFDLGGVPFGTGKVVTLPGIAVREPLARVQRHGSHLVIQALAPRETAVVLLDGAELEAGAGARPLRLGQTVSLRVRVMAGIEKRVDLLLTDTQSVADQPREEVAFDPSDASPY